MGRIVPSRSIIQCFSRKLNKEEHKSIVYNKKTGHMHTRDNSKMGKQPPTAAQIACREKFKHNLQKASAWMKANNPEAHPPCGTEEWQRVMKQFGSQDKIGYPLQYIISLINKDSLALRV